MDIKKVDNSIALCPICNGSYYKVKELDVNFIKNKLSQHFNNRIDEGVEIIDYTLLKCNDCSFEYSFPLTEGSSSFILGNLSIKLLSRYSLGILQGA